MPDAAYMVEFKLPQFEWTHWTACPTLDEAESALAARRKEMADPGDKYVRFRIVKHEIVESDVAGPIDIEKCLKGHSFVKLPSHPVKNGVAQCPYCLYMDTSELENQLAAADVKMAAMQASVDKAQVQLAKLVGVVCALVRTADRVIAEGAIAAYEKYQEEYKSHE